MEEKYKVLEQTYSKKIIEDITERDNKIKEINPFKSNKVEQTLFVV